MNYLELLWLRLVVMQRNAIEFFKVIWRYYPNRGFRPCDFKLLSRYFFRNPYRLCRRYFQERGLQEPYFYGETPLTSLEKIAAECSITDQDTVFELGCGRARGCLWLHYFVGCKVVGIELVPTFVAIAQEIKRKYDLQNIEFRLEDILTTDYQGATVIYLYGTCYEDDFILKLIDRLEKLPSGTKIITVSYSLIEYTDSPIFTLIKTFPTQFTWGVGDVYVQIVT